MKNLITKLAGDNATPAKKAAVIAALITAAALIVCGITLAVSAVVFSIQDRDAAPTDDTNTPAESGTAETEAASVVEYAAVSADELKAKLDSPVDGKTQEERTISGTKMYYGYNPKTIKLSPTARDAVHSMLVDFYTKSSSKVQSFVHDYKLENCDIPLIENVSTDGTVFKLSVFDDSSTTYENSTYAWLYTNAASYGFIYSENTFTYVGEAIAQYMKKSGVSSLDALASALSASGSIAVNATERGASKATAYQIYYLASDAEYKLPTNYEYTVTANGAVGYFVSVNLSKKASAN